MAINSEFQIIASKKFDSALFSKIPHCWSNVGKLWYLSVCFDSAIKAEILKEAHKNKIDIICSKRIAAPKAIFIDFDHTLIEQESLVVFAELVGCSDQVNKITEQAMAGEIDFEEALEQRLYLFEGVDQEKLTEVSGRLVLRKGVESFMRACKLHSVKTYLVTGGFMEICLPIVQKLGFTGLLANSFAVDDGKLTGKLSGNVIDAEAKRKFVESVVFQEGLALRDCAAIGDGANDLPMLKLVENYSVGFDPKPVLMGNLDSIVFGYPFLKEVLL